MVNYYKNCNLLYFLLKFLIFKVNCKYTKEENDLSIKVLSYQKIPINEDALKKIVATKGKSCLIQ